MPEDKLLFFQLNMEGYRQKKEIDALLCDLKPDVILAQEIFPHQAYRLAQMLDMQWATLPMLRFASKHAHQRIRHTGDFGLATLVRSSILNAEANYYPEEPAKTPTYRRPKKWVEPAYGVLTVDFNWNGTCLRVGNTHFPVSKDGLPDEKQRAYLPHLHAIIAQQELDILSGDFNAPKHLEIGQSLINAYPHVPYPEDVHTTLTPIHRAWHKIHNAGLIIDYIFTPSKRLASGKMSCYTTVSDHAALACTFSLAST